MRADKKIQIAFLVMGIGVVMLILPTGTDVKYNYLQTSGSASGQSATVFNTVDCSATSDNINVVEEKTEEKDIPDPSPEATPDPTPTPEPVVDITPEIDSMSYNCDYIAINQEVTLTQTISEKNNIDIERNYYVEIYSSRPFGDFLVAENTTCISAGDTSVKINNSFSFDTPGFLKTLIKIYDKKGGTLLYEEKGTRERTIEYVITSSKQLYGVDLFSTIDTTTAPIIKEAGYSFAVRYYSENKGKRIYRDEALAISNAGLQLVSIYQDANHTLECFTYDNGYAECMTAIDQAIEIGQPVTTPIYFTVDYNADYSNINIVYDYFNGVNAAMSDFTKKDSLRRSWKIGGYGSYFVVKSLDEQNLVSYLWQTIAWSNDQHHSYNFYQDAHDKTVAGLMVDTNYSNPDKNNDIGGFYVK
jgi:hypothetical protein